MADFRMPSLGADMDFGRVVDWLVKPGDRVERGQIIVEIETDKGTFEVESPSTGVVAALVVGTGSKVAVGTTIATINTDGAAPPPPSAPLPSAPRTSVAAPAPITPAAAPVPETPAPRIAMTGSRQIRASPAARRLAAEHGVALDAIDGTGPDHAVTIADVERALRASPTEAAPSASRISPLARRMAESLGIDATRLRGTGLAGTITKADVEAAAASRAAPVLPAPGVTTEAAPAVPAATGSADAAHAAHAAMRRAIAAAVSRSKREIPHYYLAADIDLTPALTWLERRNRQRPVADRVLPPVLLLKAVATALRRYPDLNGFWTNTGFQPSESINVGVAIALRAGGLVVPAVHDTDRKTIDELMTALRDLVSRARAGGLRGSEMTDSTVTVTSLGDEGASTVFGVIYPPQVAVVGFGRIVERPWAENGMLAARRVITATLAADHRATDGHYGGLFLAEVNQLLHAPDSL